MNKVYESPTISPASDVQPTMTCVVTAPILAVAAGFVAVYFTAVFVQNNAGLAVNAAAVVNAAYYVNVSHKC